MNEAERFHHGHALTHREVVTRAGKTTSLWYVLRARWRPARPHVGSVQPGVVAARRVPDEKACYVLGLHHQEMAPLRSRTEGDSIRVRAGPEGSVGCETLHPEGGEGGRQREVGFRALAGHDRHGLTGRSHDDVAGGWRERDGVGGAAVGAIGWTDGRELVAAGRQFLDVGLPLRRRCSTSSRCFAPQAVNSFSLP